MAKIEPLRDRKTGQGIFSNFVIPGYNSLPGADDPLLPHLDLSTDRTYSREGGSGLPALGIRYY